MAVLKAALTHEDTVPHVERLLQPLGPSALDGVLSTLASSPHEPLREALNRFLTTNGGEALTKALKARIASSPAEVAALAPQLRGLPAGIAVEVLEPAFQSEMSSIRGDAFRVAATVLAVWPTAVVERALRLDDPLIHALAFEKLSNQKDPASLNLLATLVMRRGGYQLADSTAERAAAVLLNEGVAGLRLLSDALRQLCGEIRPSKAVAARRLSRLLAPYRQERCVRIALLRWRWCVARLVSSVRWK
jgi:hypothetical protein